MCTRKALKHRNLKKRFAGQINPPLGGLRYENTLGGLRANTKCILHIWSSWHKDLILKFSLKLKNYRNVHNLDFSCFNLLNQLFARY